MRERQTGDQAASFSRRDAARLLGFAGIGALLGGPAAVAAAARQPTTAPAGLQGAGFYKLSVGDLRVTVVSDGSFPMQAAALFPQLPKDEVDAAARRAHLNPAGFVVHCHALLVQEPGGQTTLIDTGAGRSFGPTAGHLMRNLKRDGVEPGDIDYVALSHLHLDHVGGLLDASGGLAFPTAKVIVNRVEHDFWTAEAQPMPNSRLPAEMIAKTAAAAKAAMAAAKGALELVAPAENGGAITLIDTAGHTPGHVAIRVGSGEDSITHLGDAVIAPALSMAHPDWHVLFDADPVQAAATRATLLQDFAASGRRVAPSHASFPAVGYVEKAGDAYRWSAANWEW